MEQTATSEESGNRTPPAPPGGPPPPQQATKPLRPGVALAWAGLVSGIVGLVVMNIRVGGKGWGWLLLGVYGYFADMALIEVGIGLAGLGLVLSIWGLIVTIRWRSGVHALCVTGLVISLGAVLLGNHLYADYLPKYQAAEKALRTMDEQQEELSASTSAPSTAPTPSE